ncbi:MAG: hypothetical protein CFH06_00635 [Alphaproteobacteria bacterium MarineAlpha3_Bin5]|nr:MAG: hypothetical protein CFH06_00635 [Alphaproteobacteria bacterium MarineAlpha3_Bin5]
MPSTNCPHCNSTGTVIENNRILPCSECHTGWQKLCFGLQYKSKSDDPFDEFDIKKPVTH